MVEPKLRRNRKRLSSVPSPCRRQENLLLQPDVPEQSGSKVIIGLLNHLASGGHGGLKKALQSPMIICEKARYGPWFIISWMHHF